MSVWLRAVWIPWLSIPFLSGGLVIISIENVSAILDCVFNLDMEEVYAHAHHQDLRVSWSSTTLESTLWISTTAVALTMTCLTGERNSWGRAGFLRHSRDPTLLSRSTVLKLSMNLHSKGKLIYMISTTVFYERLIMQMFLIPSYVLSSINSIIFVVAHYQYFLSSIDIRSFTGSFGFGGTSWTSSVLGEATILKE